MKPSADQHDDPKPADAKRTYTTPKLEVYGELGQITETNAKTLQLDNSQSKGTHV